MKRSMVTLSKPVFVEGKLLKTGTKVIAEEMDDDFIVSELDDAEPFVEDDEDPFTEEDEVPFEARRCGEIDDGFYEDEDPELAELRARRARRLSRLEVTGDIPEGDGPTNVAGTDPVYARRMRRAEAEDDADAKALARLRALRRVRR